MDNAPLDLLAKSILKGVGVPLGHGTQTELLSKDRVHALKAEVVTLDFNGWLCTIGCVNDSSNQSTLIFKDLGVFDLVREANQEELIVLVEA